MAYRRRLTTRRRPRRTRRMNMRRRTYRSKRSLKIHHFRRTFQGGAIFSAAAANTLGAYSFTFNQLPNFAEFQSLYDCYRINKIVIKFVPNDNVSQVGAAGYIANFNTVLDFNDATVPANLNQLLEYGNWRMTRGTKIHTRIFTPASLDTVSGTSTNPTYKQWLSTADAAIPHFGLKYCAEGTAAAGDLYWVPYVTMYFSCKAVK